MLSGLPGLAEEAGAEHGGGSEPGGTANSGTGGGGYPGGGIPGGGGGERPCAPSAGAGNRPEHGDLPEP